MKPNKFKQGLAFIFSLLIMALGVVVSVKANLGLSPISCAPYVYSLVIPLTLGQTVIIFNILLIFLQILVLGKKYQIFQLIQLPVIVVFGFFIDLIMYCTQYAPWLLPHSYLKQIFLCLLSCLILGVGVFFQARAALTYLPGEGLAMAFVRRFGVEFGKAKIAIDSSLVAIGIGSSLLFLGTLEGIREGTMVSAVLVGYIVRVLRKRFAFFEQRSKTS